MKKLELNQMEGLEGGISCSGGTGVVVGATAIFLMATVLSGGFALFAGAYFLSGVGGGLLAATNCDSSIWN